MVILFKNLDMTLFFAIFQLTCDSSVENNEFSEDQLQVEDKLILYLKLDKRLSRDRENRPLK